MKRDTLGTLRARIAELEAGSPSIPTPAPESATNRESDAYVPGSTYRFTPGEPCAWVGESNVSGQAYATSLPQLQWEGPDEDGDLIVHLADVPNWGLTGHGKTIHQALHVLGEVMYEAGKDDCSLCTHDAALPNPEISRAELAEEKLVLAMYLTREWRRRAEAAEAALRGIQWGNDELDSEGTVYHLCPECDRSEVRGHAEDCCVGIALARVVEGTTNAK